MTEPITIQESARKLLLLSTFLDTLEDYKFNYTFWGRKEKKEDVDKRLIAVASNDASKSICGSTACALGWATTIEEFKADGLCLETWYLEGRIALGFSLHDKITGVEGTHAACRIFGVSEEEADFLFNPSTFLEGSNRRRSPPYEAKPKEVAEHIRLFVAEHRISSGSTTPHALQTKPNRNVRDE